MYYIVAVNTFFPNHVEVEQLSPISYITTGHRKVCHLLPCFFNMTLKLFFTEHLLHSESLNSHHREVKHIHGRKNIFLKLLMPKKHYKKRKISQIDQWSNRLVVVGPEVYHDGFIVNYGVAYETNSASFCWPDAEELPASNLKIWRPFLQRTPCREKSPERRPYYWLLSRESWRNKTLSRIAVACSPLESH